MNYRKLLMGAFLTSAICLVSVFGLTEKAGAWSWYGFSELTIDDAVRGPEGGIINITFSDMLVNVQCYNINTGNLDQPGTGNVGGLEINASVEPDPAKNKGIISVLGELSMDLWGDHDGDDHIHICFPYNNVNKIELDGTAVIYEFTADWVWYKYADQTGPDAPIMNSGTDKCTWTGEIDVDGHPEHEAPFECVSVSNKKLKFVD